MERVTECHQALNLSMRHNYAFLEMYKLLVKHVDEHRFSDKISLGMHLEQTSTILQSNQSFKRINADIDTYERVSEEI
jgi:hypothetical protein